MVRPSLALLLLVGAASTAQTVYRWVDPDGTVHYSDSTQGVPKGVKVTSTDGDPITSVTSTPTAPVPVAPAVVAPVAPVRPTTLEPSAPASGEQYWRAQFKAAHHKVRDIEDELQIDTKKVDELNGMPVNSQVRCGTQYVNGVAYPANGTPPPGMIPAPQAYASQGNCYVYQDPEIQKARDRLVRNRKALEHAREEVDDLERRASSEAVPREWRR